MKNLPLEEYLPYRLLALAVLALFYGIYLVKKGAQKHRGIQTMQIGRVKEGQTHMVEMLMGIASVGIIPAQLLSIVLGWSHLPANARFTGFCVGILGDLIFLISVLCMKDSWRAGIPDSDKTALVTGGIYRFSRNPAFLGFYLQYIGVMLMYCNLLTAGFTVFAITMLHLQILQEERYLTATFGTEYLDYRRRVFRYLGRRKGMKRMLIVNTLPEDDPAAQSAIQALQDNAQEVQVLHTYGMNLHPCIGCNACWLVTPGICSVHDGYEELLKAYLEYDDVFFLAGTSLNFVDHRMKNVIDRTLPLATMYIHIVDGQCRHVPRYDKTLRFGLLYSGSADEVYLNRWMERVMLNLGGESLGAYPISNAGEVLSCI